MLIFGVGGYEFFVLAKLGSFPNHTWLDKNPTLLSETFSCNKPHMIFQNSWKHQRSQNFLVIHSLKLTAFLPLKMMVSKFGISFSKGPLFSGGELLVSGRVSVLAKWFIIFHLSLDFPESYGISLTFHHHLGFSGPV